MKKLLYPLAVLLLGTLIFVSCQREAVPVEDSNAEFQVVADRKLEGAELEAYMAKVAAMPADRVVDVVDEGLALDPVLGDPVAVEQLYCVYSVTGVQGGGCGGLPPVGGFICIQCSGAWPGGSCPDRTGSQWRHYDSNGILICTGTITGSAGIACDKCPNGGFPVVPRNIPVPVQK